MRWPTMVVALVLLFTGCGGSDQVGLGQGGPGGAVGEWLLVEGVSVVDGHPITLRVDEGTVGGIAACNNYGGDVVVADGRFEVGDLFKTEMGCPEPGVHDSESAFLDALQSVEHHERDGDQLLLRGPDVELRFDPVAPEEDAELTGTPWQLESLISGAGPDGAASSTMAPATLELDDDGSFNAYDGCNEQTGRWRLEDDDVLHLTDFITTDVACEDLREQIDHIRWVLERSPAVELDGPQLTLSGNGRALVYRAP